MKIEELIAEGEHLSRPSILLSANATGEIAGYWGGEREDLPNVVPPRARALQSIRHIITVNAGLLTTVGIPIKSSSVAIFEVETKGGDVGYRVELPDRLEFSDIKCTGTPLYGRHAPSFPPFEAVCLYGGEVVSSWLKSLGLERFEYQAAGGQPEARAYTAEWMDRSPICTGNADVVLGGWHHLWPEDDFYLPLEMRLAILTLRDAEPWYELWRAFGGNLSVRHRIT